LPKELLDALHGAALFRTLLPQAFRGEEVPLHDFVQMQIVIAAADASTAWCVGQASGCSMAAAYLKPEIAYEIWGADPRAVLAWGMGPQSRAVEVDGGYLVTGKWHFASGSRHCTWLGGHCKVVERDGSLRADAEGNPIDRTMLFKREVPKITDNWRVMWMNSSSWRQTRPRPLQRARCATAMSFKAWSRAAKRAGVRRAACCLKRCASAGRVPKRGLR